MGDYYSLFVTSENLYLNSVLDRKVRFATFLGISLLKLRLFCRYRTYCCEVSCFPPFRGRSKFTERDRCPGDRYGVTWRKERLPTLRSFPPVMWRQLLRSGGALLRSGAGRRLKEEGHGCTFFQQILHLGTRAVVIDKHIKTQAPEALEKSLCIFVCAIADTHSCGDQVLTSPMATTYTKGEHPRHPKGKPLHAACTHAQSGPTLCYPMVCSPPGVSVHGDSPRKNTGVDCHFLLQGIFPIQGSNLCLLWLLHWQADSLPLAPPGKPHHLAEPTPNSFTPPPSSPSESFGPSLTSAKPHDGNLKLKVPSFPSSLSPEHVTPPAEGLCAIAGRHRGLLTNAWCKSERSWRKWKGTEELSPCPQHPPVILSKFLLFMMMHLPTFSKFMLYWYVGTRSRGVSTDFPESFFFFLLGKYKAIQGLSKMSRQ